MRRCSLPPSARSLHAQPLALVRFKPNLQGAPLRENHLVRHARWVMDTQGHPARSPHPRRACLAPIRSCSFNLVSSLNTEPTTHPSALPPEGQMFTARAAHTTPSPGPKAAPHELPPAISPAGVSQGSQAGGVNPRSQPDPGKALFQAPASATRSRVLHRGLSCSGRARALPSHATA